MNCVCRPHRVSPVDARAVRQQSLDRELGPRGCGGVERSAAPLRGSAPRDTRESNDPVFFLMSCRTGHFQSSLWQRRPFERFSSTLRDLSVCPRYIIRAPRPSCPLRPLPRSGATPPRGCCPRRRRGAGWRPGRARAGPRRERAPRNQPGRRYVGAPRMRQRFLLFR